MIRRFAQPEVLSEAEGTSNVTISRRRNNVTIEINHRLAQQFSHSTISVVKPFSNRTIQQ